MAKYSPYGKLNVPEFKKHDAAKAQKDYFGMLDETSGLAEEATDKINRMNQSQLTKGLEESLGAGYRETWGEGLETIRNLAAGRFGEEQEKVLRQGYAARAQSQGLAGSMAGINVGVSGMGKSMLQAQQQALSMMPQFMTSARQTMMSTPTRVESMFVPIQQYASQQAAENINQWRQQYAAAQAEHTASMANTAYNIQKEQAAGAKAEAEKRRKALAGRKSFTYTMGPSRFEQSTRNVSRFS